LVDPDWHGYIGAVPIALALAALFIPAEIVPRGRVLGLFVVFVAALVLALGPQSQYHPYTWLFEAAPSFNLMRTPVRFVYPALAACVALASLSIYWARVAIPSVLLRRGLITLAFAGALLAGPLFGSVYAVRAEEPGAIWTVEIRTLPRYLQAVHQ